jgi:hypothetical protein
MPVHALQYMTVQSDFHFGVHFVPALAQPSLIKQKNLHLRLVLQVVNERNNLFLDKMESRMAIYLGAITGSLAGLELATTGGFGTIAVMKPLSLASAATGPIGPIVVDGAVGGADMGYVVYNAAQALCEVVSAIANSISDSIASKSLNLL